jgi:hypothetical protein
MLYIIYSLSPLVTPYNLWSNVMLLKFGSYTSRGESGSLDDQVTYALIREAATATLLSAPAVL